MNERKIRKHRQEAQKVSARNGRKKEGAKLGRVK